MSEYRVVRIGFDTIIVAFRATIPPEMREIICDARVRARERRSEEPLTLGNGLVPGVVLPNGVHGGYDAVFSTGELGEMWQFKTDQKGDKWPLRLKIRAGALLVYGYPGAIDNAFKRLEAFGIRIEDTRLSEVHVCIDVVTDSSFRLDDSLLLRPGRSIVRPYEILDKTHPLFDDAEPAEIQRILRGLRIQTLTIGSSKTGSQTQIYNKKDETVARRKFMLFKAYKLDTDDPSWGLWRTEFRFSGEVLKKRFEVRSFTDLERALPAMMSWAAMRIRYVAPGQADRHPTRRAIHPFWQAILEALPNLRANQPSFIPVAMAQKALDLEAKSTMEATIVGTAIALAAIEGIDESTAMAKLSSFVAEIIDRRMRDAPQTIERKISRAFARRAGKNSE
ncbi:MAG TPA: hypothetical protein VGG11_22895 [Xanthobacteraceae bacterium]|jgi:hypothetical protein